MAYKCPDMECAEDLTGHCIECEGCEYEATPIGESPCLTGECVRDGACYPADMHVE